MHRLTVLLLLASLGAGCSVVAPAAGPRPGTVDWIAGAPGPDDATCPAFDSVAADAGGWWFSGPDCLLHVAADDRGQLFPLLQGAWRFDRVDGVAASADGTVWAAGRQRVEDAVRAVMGSLHNGKADVGDPDRWDLQGVLVNAIVATPSRSVWAAGRRIGPMSVPFLAQRTASGWASLDAAAFGSGEILDGAFSPDGCGWFVGRDGAGAGMLVRFDGKRFHKEVLDRADGVPRRVAALSCRDLWLGGANVIRYAEGHREEIGFGVNAEINGLAACPDGSLLLVGERVAVEPEMQGRRVGFSFRVRDGVATSLPVELPFVVDDWRLADVGCDESGAYAVGAALARFAIDTPAERRALLLTLGESGWRYRGWRYR